MTWIAFAVGAVLGWAVGVQVGRRSAAFDAASMASEEKSIDAYGAGYRCAMREVWERVMRRDAEW